MDRPNRTLLSMVWPVLVAQATEPLVGVADTAFVSRLGADALAALGVGTATLTSAFWLFNFLGIGSQTKTAQAVGADHIAQARDIAAITLVLAAALGGGLMLVLLPFLRMITGLMGATGDMFDLAMSYMMIRLLGAPAVLIAMAGFGVLRGLQDMQTPFRIAVTINLLNIALDGLLIFGLGPIPGWGVTGAAIASAVSQWVGFRPRRARGALGEDKQ